MTRPRFLAVFLSAISSVSLAQTPSGHVFPTQSSRWLLGAPARREGLAKILSGLDRDKLRPAESGSWEAQIALAGVRAGDSVFRLNLSALGLPWMYTLSTEGGDVLVARWTAADSGRPEKAIWLWDTPYDTVVIAEVDPSTVSSSAFPAYCEQLFAWKKPHLSSLELAFLPQERGTTWVVGGMRNDAPLPTEFGLWLSGMSTGESAYVAVGLSKRDFPYPAAADNVPERFPPLRSRLSNVPREALFQEIGKGYVSPQLRTYPTNRDTIVLSELVSRGPLCVADIQQIVTGGFHTGENPEILNRRTAALLSALNGENQLAANVLALQHFLLETQLQVAEWLQDEIAARVFGAMQRSQIDFSGTAVDLLEKGRFVSSSLFYLGQNARDEETFQKVSKTAVKPDLEKKKQMALDQIKRNMTAKAKPRGVRQ